MRLLMPRTGIMCAIVSGMCQSTKQSERMDTMYSPVPEQIDIAEYKLALINERAEIMRLLVRLYDRPSYQAAIDVSKCHAYLIPGWLESLKMEYLANIGEAWE